MRTYQEVKKAVLEKNFLFSTLEMFANYVFERTSYEVTNKFDDFWHVLWIENGEEKILTIKCTTKAGLKGAFDAPPTVEGIHGTAVIIFPQECKNAWKFIDGGVPTRSYPWNHSYFAQIAPINYWRDGNKDTHIDKVQEQDKKIFGTQWHVMSNPPPAWQSGNVNNWSEGCMGAEYAELEKILPIARKSAAVYGNVVSGICLNKEDIG